MVIFVETASVKFNSLEEIAKAKKKISYEEFLELCDEDTLAEWVNGEIIMTSPASRKHQEIAFFLQSILHSYVEFYRIGEILGAPFQMKLPLSGREPDIIFVHSDHLDRLKDTFLDGPADMVVEIISKDSVSRDRGDKFMEYESAGIAEYWLIDPTRKQAEFYRLGDDNCYHQVLLDAEGKYHSEIIKGFWFKPSWLWQEPLPPDWEIRRELNLP
ncbi:TPA: Uma2 family endonuclease [Candidatus Poribacteria bacterium]|nr:Uma2 family endonuclease [Candidatus Poribacteria bacterium]